MNALKQRYVARAERHQAADNFRQGFYWEDGKGCCVGCLAEVNYYAHEALRDQTNIPEWLSRLSDTIHEGLDYEASKLWPARFIKAVPEQVFSKKWADPKTDKKIKAPFLIMVLQSAMGSFDHAKFPDVRAAVDGSIALWQRNDIGTEEWNSAARSAAETAKAARWSTRWSARSARSARSAAEAAEAAAEADRTTGVVAAVWLVAAVAAAAAAGWRGVDRMMATVAVRKKKYAYFADQLIAIMEAAASKGGA